MSYVKRAIVLFAFVVSFQNFSFAWGCSGHQIVALIAERLLNDKASAQVQALLHNSTLYNNVHRACSATELGDMAMFSTWADDFRLTAPGKVTKPWHFWDVPLTATDVPGATDFCGEGCVVKAIQDSMKTLQSKGATKAAKTKALVLLIHFVGDLHQPLHIATNNDRGGNCFPLTFFGRAPKLGKNGYSPELHGIWDTDMPEKIGHIRHKTHDDDLNDFVDTLMSDFDDPIKEWESQNVDVIAWAWESHEHAVSDAYGKLTPKHVEAEEPVDVTSCTDDNSVGERMLDLDEVVNQKYVTAVTPVIEEQLAKGGTRLAVILNQIWK